MKNYILFIATFVLTSFGASASTHNINNTNSIFYDNGESFTFVERGVTFAVFQNGEFDFYINPRKNLHVGYQGNGVNISFNSGYNYDAYVQYDDYGAIIQVEDIYIDYDYYGRVDRIGNTRISYDRGRLVSLGGLHVYYNTQGYYSHCSGYINVFNRHYTYHPYHNFFTRPLFEYSIVSYKPYRHYYQPIRYTYHHDHSKNKYYNDRYRYSNNYSNKSNKNNKNYSKRDSDYSTRTRYSTTNVPKRSNDNSYSKSNDNYKRIDNSREKSSDRGATTHRSSEDGKTDSNRIIGRDYDNNRSNERNSSITKRNDNSTNERRTIERAPINIQERSRITESRTYSNTPNSSKISDRESTSRNSSPYNSSRENSRVSSERSSNSSKISDRESTSRNSSPYNSSRENSRVSNDRSSNSSKADRSATKERSSSENSSRRRI